MFGFTTAAAGTGDDQQMDVESQKVQLRRNREVTRSPGRTRPKSQRNSWDCYNDICRASTAAADNVQMRHVYERGDVKEPRRSSFDPHEILSVHLINKFRINLLTQ